MLPFAADDEQITEWRAFAVLGIVVVLIVLARAFDPGRRMDRLLARAGRACAKGHWDRAVALLHEAEVRWPDLTNVVDFQLALAGIEENAGRTPEALKRYRALLQTVPSTDAKFVEVADGFGTAALAADLVSVYAEAEIVIRRAMEAFPEQETLRGTLAGLLVEQGRIEEGRALVELHYLKKLSDNDTGISAAYLAKLAALRGDEAEAKRYADEARLLCGSHLLVTRLVGSPERAS